MRNFSLSFRHDFKMSLYALSSSMVKPIKTGDDWKKCVKNSRTITINHGKIVHKLSKDVLPDPNDIRKNKQNGYMETYFLDEESQLEKRIAIGDSSFLEDVPQKHRKLMEDLIEDIQNQLLTHNGFVTKMRDYHKKVYDEISTQMTQHEQDFDANHLSQFQFEAHEDFDVEEFDENTKFEGNPLLKLPVNKKDRRALRLALLQKKDFLKEKRQLLKEKLVDNIEFRIHNPIKNPTTIEDRTLNDPRKGVGCAFVPSDQPRRPQATFFQSAEKLQTVTALSSAYDLMSYPLFFPEGNAHQYGWTPNNPFVLKKTQLIESEFERIKDKLTKEERENAKTFNQKVECISQILEIKDLKHTDYNYKQLVKKGGSKKQRQYISCREWYNFMFHERAGFIKKQVYTPRQELHEYHTACNLKLKPKKRKKILSDKHVYKENIELNDRTFQLQVHPKSRVPFIIEDGVEKTIDPNTNGDPDSLREPEKKNPILYGERLKLFYFCDMGLKVDDNEIGFLGTDSIQKKMRQIDLKTQKKLDQEQKPVENEGKPKVLNSTHKKSKKWFRKKYLNAIAMSGDLDGADLFITVTGSDSSRELRHLHCGRTPGTCPDLTNRLFHMKLKDILDDIIQKQIFGRVIGRVWVIEYQKR